MRGKRGKRELRVEEHGCSAEQSCLRQDKWRYNSIVAMTKGQVPSTKSLLASNTSVCLFFQSLSSFQTETGVSKKGRDFTSITSVLFLIFTKKVVFITACLGVLRHPLCWVLCGINGILNLQMRSQYAPNRWCVAFLPRFLFFSTS